MECGALIGKRSSLCSETQLTVLHLAHAVGKNTFRPDAQEFCGSLLDIQSESESKKL